MEAKCSNGLGRCKIHQAKSWPPIRQISLEVERLKQLSLNVASAHLQIPRTRRLYQPQKSQIYRRADQKNHSTFGSWQISAMISRPRRFQKKRSASAQKIKMQISFLVLTQFMNMDLYTWIRESWNRKILSYLNRHCRRRSEIPIIPLWLHNRR